MFKKCVSIIVILSILSFLYSSCSRDDIIQPKGNTDLNESDSESLQEELETAPEVKELLEIRTEMMDRALKRDITGKKLLDAYMAKDEQKMVILLGYSDTEVEKYRNRLYYLSNSLCDRYPELRKMVAEKKGSFCATCEVEQFADKWDDYRMKYKAGILCAPAMKPAMCQIIPLTIGLILCAVSLPTVLLYLLCSYIVACSFCEGGWADIIC